MDHVKRAKEFCNTYLPMLTDKQHERTVRALARWFEDVGREAINDFEAEVDESK